MLHECAVYVARMRLNCFDRNRLHRDPDLDPEQHTSEEIIRVSSAAWTVEIRYCASVHARVPPTVLSGG
jgi:hypothetical protein